MATELKTLKDIESRTELDLAIASDMPIKQRPTYHQLLIYNLRQEAIRWYNELDHEHARDAERGAMQFIKTFFNLTDEDLKAKVKDGK